MRTHYLNCDINELTWRGVGWTSMRGDGDQWNLVNGLNLKQGQHGERKGEYTNILTALPADLAASTILLLFKPMTMVKTISKTITYATTGMLPFIDLSTAFKIPCADIDEDFLKNAKYDFGKWGRYGHPLSPFSILALSTLQLPSDIEKRDSNCGDLR